jgi:hypothetical protein
VCLKLKRYFTGVAGKILRVFLKKKSIPDKVGIPAENCSNGCGHGV